MLFDRRICVGKLISSGVVLLALISPEYSCQYDRGCSALHGQAATGIREPAIFSAEKLKATAERSSPAARGPLSASPAGDCIAVSEG